MPVVKLASTKHKAVGLLFSALLSACSDSSDSPPDLPNISDIHQASLRDTNGETLQLSGQVKLQLTANAKSQIDFFQLQFADAQGEAIGESFQQDYQDANKLISLNDIAIPEGASSIILHAGNKTGLSELALTVPFHDFTGNALMSGPGGNEQSSWQYQAGSGDSLRLLIAIHRDNSANPVCTFDNGLVAATDMHNTKDHGTYTGANTVDEAAFPAFSFECDETPHNTARAIEDEVGVWTYSTLNDAMHYGTVVYDSFLTYLREPALKDKLRLRIHYDNKIYTDAFWDGAYANFTDGYLSHYSLASLDIIAHEIGHGVLDRISQLKIHNDEMSNDARTLHEAFGDISAVMAKYFYTGELKWRHGLEALSPDHIYDTTRHLDKIITESGAIASALDYSDAGTNPYKRIGIFTYPFYLLTEKWGAEKAYQVYLGAARNCWQADTDLQQAALCIKQQAVPLNLATKDVEQAFQSVKIQLAEQGVLSHFKLAQQDLTITLQDNSQSTSDIIQWHWQFGDGSTSTERNPQHTYSTPGEYTVQLTVTDNNQYKDVFGRTITVQSAD